MVVVDVLEDVGAIGRGDARVDEGVHPTSRGVVIEGDALFPRLPG